MTSHCGMHEIKHAGTLEYNKLLFIIELNFISFHFVHCTAMTAELFNLIALFVNQYTWIFLCLLVHMQILSHVCYACLCNGLSTVDNPSTCDRLLSRQVSDRRMAVCDVSWQLYKDIEIQPALWDSLVYDFLFISYDLQKDTIA